MSIVSVKEHFRTFNREQDVLEFATSSATVEMAAATIGVIPARIAKYDELALYSKSTDWVDVCKGWDETPLSGDGQAL